MADIKNFGIRGIGADVQFGKSGGRVVYDSGNSLFKVTTDGTTLGKLSVLTPTSDNHAANKGYVDSVASGLDVKDSVRAASTGYVNYQWSWLRQLMAFHYASGRPCTT